MVSISKTPVFALILFLGSFLPSFAQEPYPRLTCQEKVNEVIKKIKREGVNKVDIKVLPQQINRVDNPTNRTDELIFVMTPTNKRTQLIIDDIINSATLLRVWSDAVVENCGNTAIVRFRIANSNFVRAYYVQYDGTTKQVECLQFTAENYPWGTEYCPTLLK